MSKSKGYGGCKIVKCNEIANGSGSFNLYISNIKILLGRSKFLHIEPSKHVTSLKAA
jgi:hypothetical protein